ncbi:glycosyltransferase family 4 protein [Xanthomarina sp. F2636L]|uniref:glycosyltransferase family 4 protein n=1 Tax=Xanthomarina sp. F2636L TaxID=2996018 RepID=UPI00225E6185|nr:glycosyltransferase family 4 protein [Xanthomarina sp. F2636L]MCX7549511.1 glycosyltransferase family 4 protein [Xanthomarina sp. F2636L]
MKKTIAFVIPNLNAGGAERVVSSLANLLVEEYHIIIITLYRCEPFYTLHPNIKITYCVKEYFPDLNLFQSLSINYKLIKHLTRHLKSEKADIAIGFLPATNIYTILASKLSKIPNIINERANPEFNRINKFWQTIRKLIYPYCNCLVVQTKGTKGYFKNYKIPQIQTIKNPLNAELLKKRNPLLTKENIILNVGRLIELKNQDLLIRAFSNIENTGWKVILVGDGNKYEDYKELISSLGLKTQIILTGNIKDVSEYFNKAKIFAFTSKHEGFPNVILEAMSYGLACVSTDCPYGPSEIIDNNNNGMLIPVGDQKALENALTELMENSELQNTFRENAMNSIKTYEPSNIALKWSKLINEIIEN